MRKLYTLAAGLVAVAMLMVPQVPVLGLGGAQAAMQPSTDSPAAVAATLSGSALKAAAPVLPRPSEVGAPGSTGLAPERGGVVKVGPTSSAHPGDAPARPVPS